MIFKSKCRAVMICRNVNIVPDVMTKKVFSTPGLFCMMKNNTDIAIDIRIGDEKGRVDSPFSLT